MYLNRRCSSSSGPIRPRSLDPGGVVHSRDEFGILNRVRPVPSSPNTTLVRIMRSQPSVDAHNRLMRMTDREIGLSMMYMDQADRNYVLALVPGPKARRVREELALQERLTIRYDQYVTAVNHVTQMLQAGSGEKAFRSYLRPRRYTR